MDGSLSNSLRRMILLICWRKCFSAISLPPEKSDHLTGPPWSFYELKHAIHHLKSNKSGDDIGLVTKMLRYFLTIFTTPCLLFITMFSRKVCTACLAYHLVSHVGKITEGEKISWFQTNCQHSFAAYVFLNIFCPELRLFWTQCSLKNNTDSAKVTGWKNTW